MKLNRTIETWDKCDAGAMSKMSEAAIKYAFADAKADIKRLAAIQAQLVEALQTVIDRFGPGQNHEIFSKRHALQKVRSALAAAGSQP